MLLLKLPEFRINVEGLAEIPLPDFLTALWKVSVKKKERIPIRTRFVYSFYGFRDPKTKPGRSRITA